jgi:hypothetical protein
MDIEVTKPSGEYLAEYWNRRVSDNPDKTDGPVVFLRTSLRISDKPFQRDIVIRPDQKLFVPGITSVINRTDDQSVGDDESKQRSIANNDIDDGDNPPNPNSVTIDGKPITDSLESFRIESPQFDLKVKSKCELEEVTYEEGKNLPSVAAGYCLLVESLPKRDKPYTIHVKTNGSRGYSTEAIYTIRVE